MEVYSSSDKEQTIELLRQAYPSFQPNDYPEYPDGNLETKATQFEDYVKGLNLRFALADIEAVEYY